MIRKLQVLALALFAASALSAVAASAAFAETTDVFTSEVSPTIITGEQVGPPEANVFGTKSSSLEVTCANAKFGPTTIVGTAVESITTHPEYSGCTAGVFGEAPVTTTGCNYILTGTTDAYTNTNGEPEGKDATVGVECGSNPIKIAGLGCTISIPGGGANANLLGVTYDNEGTGTTRDVKVTVTVDNISYTSSGIFCGLVGIKSSGSDAFLTEEVTVKGDKDENGKAGAQVGIEVSEK